METIQNNEFVYVSREFTNRFKSTTENRMVNHGHLSRLKQQMEISLHTFPPVTINKQTNHIIDGQHRISAFQKLVDEGKLTINAKLPVMYANMTEEDEQEAIINANTNSKNWSLDDFMLAYSHENAEYKKLESWAKAHTLCFDGKKTKYRYAAAILKQQNCAKLLKDGSFSISNDDLKNGEKIHGELVELLAALKKPTNGNYIEGLTLAWSSVRSLHPFKEWLKEVRNKKNAINKKPFANKKDWGDIFSLVSTAINVKNR